MLSFIFRRILYSIPLLFVISIIIFFIIELPPGDYATWYVSQTKALANITQEQALELTIMLREKYGLNEPLVIRYFNWIKNIVLNFDFGFSMHYNKPVSEMLGDRLPRTLVIALICHFFATTIGVFIGIYAAKNQNKLGDNIATIFAFFRNDNSTFLFSVTNYVLVSNCSKFRQHWIDVLSILRCSTNVFC